MGRHTIICWRSNAPLDWSGETAAIIASGPSAATTDFELLRRGHVIAVNLSWQLVPWAEVLYASDGAFWFIHDGVPQFSGRKITSSQMAAQRFGLDCLFTTGNNSGLRAFHLAEAFGAKRLLLIGFDMHVQAGLHWHQPHAKSPLHNPTGSSVRLWRDEIQRIAGTFAKRGIEVINCTPGSALQCFPQMPLHQAMQEENECV
jgi:hypothetical protein